MLEKVDGAWPPHDVREESWLRTVEDKLSVHAGESYFMHHQRIHDVEVEQTTAKRNPAITLFFASEARMIPYAYVLPELATYHEENSGLRRSAAALPLHDWASKLRLVAEYLRGEIDTLNLDDVVKYDGEYAFFHRLASR